MSNEVTSGQEMSPSSEAELTPVEKIERKIIAFQTTGKIDDYPGLSIQPAMAVKVLSQIVNREEAKSYLREDTERLKIAEEFIHVGILYGGVLYDAGIHYMYRLVDKYRSALEKQEKSKGTAAMFSNPEDFEVHVGKKVFDGLKRIVWAPIQEMIDRSSPRPTQK